MQTWPPKDPDDVLDFSVDWTDVLTLDDDTVASVAWTIPAGLTNTQELNAAGVTAVWLSGGVIGERYEVGCRMVTAGGRTYDRTIALSVRRS